MRVNDEPRTVVGVLGEGPADHQQNKMWMPLAFTEAQLQSDNTSLLVMARLKDDVTVDQANASMAALGASLEQRPQRRRRLDGTRRGVPQQFRARQHEAGHMASARRGDVRAAHRLRERCEPAARARHGAPAELAIRAAVGATATSIVRQLLVESLVLALAGGLLGALLAASIVDAIVALMPPFTLPSETEITMSIPVLLFAFAVCTLAGVAAAWRRLAGIADTCRRDDEGRRPHSRRSAIRPAQGAGGDRVRTGADTARRWGMAVDAMVRTMRVDHGFRPITDDVRASGAAWAPATVEQAQGFYRVAVGTHRNAAGRRVGISVDGHAGAGTDFGGRSKIAGGRVANPRRSAVDTREHGDARPITRRSASRSARTHVPRDRCRW